MIFLSEAFTRPHVMHRLAKLGFTQSYTYFTWRNTKAELTEYFTELAQDAVARVLPPELLAEHAGHPAVPPAERRPRRPSACAWCSRRRWRRTTASTARPSSWARTAPREPGSEEYLDREKYQLRHWDRDAPGQPRAAHHAAEPDPPRATRRCSPTGASPSTPPTTTQLIAYSKHERRRPRAGGREPRSAQHAERLGRRRRRRARPRARRGASRCTTLLSEATLSRGTGGAQLRAPRSRDARPRTSSPSR